MRDAAVLAERINRARNALRRIHVKTRDVGECVLCHGRTSSGMDKLCPKCADAELLDVASILTGQESSVPAESRGTKSEQEVADLARMKRAWDRIQDDSAEGL